MFPSQTVPRLAELSDTKAKYAAMFDDVLRNYLILSPWPDESDVCLALVSAMISCLFGVVLLLFVSTCTVVGQIMFESDSLEGRGDL